MTDQITAIIKEIANQLGISADEVIMHLSDLFPIYARYIATEKIAMFAVALIVFIASTIVVWKIIKAFLKTDNESSEDTLFLASIGAAIVALLSLFLTCFLAPSAIAAIASPEGVAMVELLSMFN